MTTRVVAGRPIEMLLRVDEPRLAAKLAMWDAMELDVRRARVPRQIVGMFLDNAYIARAAADRLVADQRARLHAAIERYIVALLDQDGEFS